MAILLRIILLLLPLLAIAAWLRWRMKEDKTEEERLADLAKLQKSLALLVLVGIAAGLGLKIVDDRTGDPRTKYIPPHSENGQVVPGRFVPDGGDDTPSGEEEGQEGSEQNPG